MRLFTLFGAVVVFGMSAAAGAATPTAEAMVPVRAFIDSFNKGDMKAAAVPCRMSKFPEKIAPITCFSAGIRDYPN